MSETEVMSDFAVMLSDAIESLPEKTDLIFIDRDEALSDEQCAKMLGGERDSIIEDFDFTESEDFAIDSYLENVFDEEEAEQFRNSEAFDQFVQECRERDASDPYSDLVSHTGRKLVRFYFRNQRGDRTELESGSWRWDDARIEREAKRLGEAAGLDFAANREVLREVVREASYGGELCIIAYIEMQDADKWVNYCLRNDRARVTLTFHDPQLLVLDSINGSGHDVKVKGEVKIRFRGKDLDPTEGVMALDAKNVGTGYGWDETAGLYKPAYICDPKARLYDAR